MRALIAWSILLALGLQNAAWSRDSVWLVPQVRVALRQKFALPEAATGPAGYRLSHLLQTCRRTYPAAVVTSGFYDLRGLSRYRSRPGLHLGYDIAMPYGTGVRAAWPGRIVAVTPWHGEEVGVTVLHADGTQATYGHVKALLQPGDSVVAGQTLASIAADHLDLKMRDAAGEPVDYGTDDKPQVPTPPLQLSRNQLLASWLVYRGEWESSLLQLREASLPLVEPELRNATLQRRLEQLEIRAKDMPGFYESGLVSRHDVENTQAELKKARRQWEQLSSRSGKGGARQRVRSIALNRDAIARELKRIQKQAQARGLKWEQAVSLGEAVVARDAVLRRVVAAYPPEKMDMGQAALSTQVKAARQRLEQLEQLFQIGGVAQLEVEEARAELRLLEAEWKLLQDLVAS